MNLYVFNGQTDELLTVLNNNNDDMCPFYEPQEVEQLNKDFTFEFSVPADRLETVHIKEGNLVAYKDLDGDFQLFQIFKTEEEHSDSGLVLRVFTEHAYYELADDIVTDLRVIDGTALDALTKALNSSRWTVGTVDSLGLGTVNFYYSNAIKNIQDVVDEYGGELKFRVVMTGNKITSRLVDLKTRRGADTGKRFEFNKDMTQIKRTVRVDGLKTALYGRGAGQELETGGYSRRTTFADVVWSVANGDPVDKPLGQEWVGLPEALTKYGREGGTRHKFETFDVDSTDPATILNETFKELQRVSVPHVTYEMTVVDLGQFIGLEHETVRLGDTVFVIDRELGLRIEARVLGIKRDMINPENTEVVLGNFIDDITGYNSKITEIEATLSDRKGVWDSPVVDGDIINETPVAPTTVTAKGLFKSILTTWTFDPSIKIANYELYGSQVLGFTPDSTNLLYRGKTGGFVVEAGTNQTWYFRVRAVNPHGVASPYTTEFSASTLRVGTPDFENLSVTNAIIKDVSADKMTVGTLDAGLVTVVNLNADNINVGRLKAQFVEIGSTTTFSTGYDPTKIQVGGRNIFALKELDNQGWYVDSRSFRASIWASVIYGNAWVLENLSPNTEYVFTATYTVESLSSLPPFDEKIGFLLYDGSTGTDVEFGMIRNFVVGGVYTVETKFTTPSSLTGYRILGYTSRYTDGTTVELGTVLFQNVQLEKGNKATDWNQAPEDIADQIALVENRVSDVELKVTEDSIVSTVRSSVAYSNDFAGKADTAYVDGNFATNTALDGQKTQLEGYTDTKVGDVYAVLGSNPDSTKTVFEQISAVDQKADSLDIKFTSSGGVNLLKNSTGYSNKDFWTTSNGHLIEDIQNNELDALNIGSGFWFQTGARADLYQNILVEAGREYTLSWFIKKAIVSGATTNLNTIIHIRDETGGTVYHEWFTGENHPTYTHYSMTFTPVTSTIQVRVISFDNTEDFISGLMLNVGTLALQWQHSAGEIYNTNVLMDLNGIRVNSNTYNGYTAITPTEFAGYAEVSGTMKKVFTLNKDVTEMSKVKIENELGMTPIKVVPVQSTSYNGWAFIAEE